MTFNVNDNEWSDEQYLEWSKQEPKRLEFWRKYCSTELEAAKAVCDNYPSFDKVFQQEFPNPEEYKKIKSGAKLASKPTHNSRSAKAEK